MSDFTNFPSVRGILEFIWLRYKAEELYGCFNLCQMKNYIKSSSACPGLRRAAKSVWLLLDKRI